MIAIWDFLPILVFVAVFALMLMLHRRQRRTTSDWWAESRDYQNQAMANQQRLIDLFEANNRLLSEIRDRLARGSVH